MMTRGRLGYLRYEGFNMNSYVLGTLVHMQLSMEYSTVEYVHTDVRNTEYSLLNC
jgi:hypothetical protein